MNRHISEQYDAELESLRLRLMEMGGIVEKQLGSATQAFTTHDAALASDVRNGEEEVNRLEIVIDDQAVHIIARRQPAASDLRLLISIMKTCTDLERVGDEADRIAKMAIAVTGKPMPHNHYSEITSLSSMVAKMVGGALDAFARLDVATAYGVIATDKEVDRQYDDIIASLDAELGAEPELAGRIISKIWVARALERIGDHAKNICEQVVYLVDGLDVRHGGAKNAP